MRTGVVNALAAQLGDDGKAIAARQHAVDHKHVVGVFGPHEEAAFAVACMVGDNTRLTKGFREIGRRFQIVFDDEKSFMRPTLPAGCVSARLKA